MLKSVRFWIGFGVSAVCIFLLLQQADPRKVYEEFTHANYFWLIPAVSVYFAAVWVRAIRYEHIVRTLRPVRAALLFPLLVIGYMANNLLPFRMGEIVRSYLLGERHQISKMASLGTTAVERLFDGLALLALLAGSVVVLGANGTIHDVTLIALGIFAFALAVFIACLASPDGSERLVATLARPLPLKIRGKVMGLATSFIEGLRSLRHPKAITWVVATSLVAWLIETVAYLCVGKAFGLELSWAYYVMAMSAGNLIMIAPSTPGGTGAFEYGVTQALLLANIDPDLATAYAFGSHITILVPATILGLYYLWSMRLSLTSLTAQAGAALEPVGVEEELPTTRV